MKNSVTIICLVCMALLAGCQGLVEGKKDGPLDTERQKKANWIKRQITYIEDPRTHLCYAYFFEGREGAINQNRPIGGPAFTVVPCDSIPDELLIVAK